MNWPAVIAGLSFRYVISLDPFTEADPHEKWENVMASLLMAVRLGFKVNMKLPNPIADAVNWETLSVPGVAMRVGVGVGMAVDVGVSRERVEVAEAAGEVAVPLLQLLRK